MNTLLITTRGRKAGTLQRTALIYGVDGDRWVAAGEQWSSLSAAKPRPGEPA